MSKRPQIPVANPLWFWIVYAFVFVVVVVLEVLRFKAAVDADMNWMICLSYWDMETTAPVLVLAVLPLLFWGRKRYRRTNTDDSVNPNAEVAGHGRMKLAVICIALFGLTVASSYRIGSWSVDLNFHGVPSTIAFAELPPTYHDEFSYMLQAATFSNGQLSFPPAPIRPDLFHQFHVLNERRTVSRYFPLTGAWIAGAILLGEPIHGHWVAGGLATVFFYLSLLRIVSPGTSLFAGILIAVSPGIAVFSNLLLAHHPTLLTLSIFTYSFLRMDESRRLRWALAAGTALALAMLGRPMTAAGYALPYGLLLLGRMINEPVTRKLAVGFVVPLGLGFAVLGIQNQDATGSVFKSAYQSYTDTFTPRHKYGFNNASQTPQPAGPPAMKSYDDWATNLTPRRAVENVWSRLKASFQWALAAIPILFGVLMSLPLLVATNAAGDVKSVCYLRLIACSILTLHLVHVPYWFDGILHWHYVFETAPLLLIMTAVGLASASSILWSRIGRMGLGWVALLVIAGLLPGWFQLPMYGDVSKVSASISEQAYSRTRMEYFGRLVSDPSVTKPALVLVDEEGTDPQLSYILNPPDYQGKVLTCRLPATDQETAALQQFFAERTLYVFDPKQFDLRPWTPSD